MIYLTFMSNPEDFQPEKKEKEEKLIRIEIGGVMETFKNFDEAAEYFRQMREEQG